MGKFIDMHIHSKFSDGELSIDEILQEAYSNYAKIISIADHDDTRSIENIKNSTINNSLICIPGSELSTSIEFAGKKVKIHLLGYGIEDRDNYLNNIFRRKKIDIAYANREFVEVFLKNCTFINPDIFVNFDYEKYGYIQKLIKHFINFDTLSDEYKNYINNFFGKTKPVYKDYGFFIEEAIDIVKKLGGYSVFAHPDQTKLNQTDSELLLRLLIDYGIDGIEVYNSDSKSTDNEFADYLAVKYQLLKSCGSDYHGIQNDPNKRICYGMNNNMCIEECSIASRIIYEGKYLSLKR